ncbi:TPA: ATP-binding protein [Candidatus Ventrenecus stercoripullorum]|nr:ATP-binding protein [Candidatus Ventrenecus stercoripullorum]
MKRIDRDNYLSILKNFKDQQIIKVISGIRRCGKSTLLEIYQDYLINNGVSKNQIISINFENADYEELQDRKKLYEYIKNKLVKGKKTYIFLDEIQNVYEFEKTVDSLFINKEVDLYITGSNAYLLSSELATLLTGRYIEIKMLPLSFKEYISAFDAQTDISRKFRDYLRYSSFPQAVELYKINPENINMFLDGIYNTILFKDVMQRKGITDKNLLERITKYLYDNIGNRTSVKSIVNNIEGLEKKPSYNTISNYINALLDSYLIFRANRYDIKGKEYLKTQEKYYAIDIGLRYYMLGQNSGKDMGHILENVVYLELLRRGYKVYIGKLDELEVDFVAKKTDNTVYYQVALTTRSESDNENKILDRELTPLKKINDNYPKYILTLDDDLDADFDGIKKRNVLDWLLEEKD